MRAHLYGDSFTGMLCGAMVALPDGSGDLCGLPVEHAAHIRDPEHECCPACVRHLEECDDPAERMAWWEGCCCVGAFDNVQQASVGSAQVDTSGIEA